MSILAAEPVLVLITPDFFNADLHAQLVSTDKKDKVHPLNGIPELYQNRLGFEDSSRQCWALVREHDDGARELTAAIYVDCSLADTSVPSPSFLPGKVDTILTSTACPLQASPTLMTFYSISSFERGSGSDLIERLHRKFAESGNPPYLTTLSPLRGLGAWLEANHPQDEYAPDQLKAYAGRYLSQRLDGVQNFHQGNGAYLGGIHLDANAPGSKDAQLGHNVMVNYRYPRTQFALYANRRDYKAGKIPASSHIRPLLEAAPA